MRYYFSSPESARKLLSKLKVRHFLLSYVLEGKNHSKYDGKKMMDSGAFTVWNSTKKQLDVDDYISFCKCLDRNIICVNLDVIPETGGTNKEIQMCADQSYENFEYIRSEIANPLLPVFHYGEKLGVLKRYMGETDYIGLSPANDTHVKTKHKFFDQCFRVVGSKVKTHAFGFSQLEGLYRYPFYSVDSAAWKRYRPRVSKVKTRTMWLGDKNINYLMIQSIKKYIKLERDVTEVWTAKGVTWDD